MREDTAQQAAKNNCSVQVETKTASTSPAPPTTAEISPDKFQTLLEDWLSLQSPEVTAQLTLDYESDVKPIHVPFAEHCMEDLECHLSVLFQYVEPDLELTRVGKGKLVKQKSRLLLVENQRIPRLDR